MTNWVVVGASGFVGSAVAQRIEADGGTVVAVSAPRLSTPARSVPALAGELDRFAPVVSDLAQAFAGADVVVNAAGLAEPGSAPTDALFGANALLPTIVALAAARAGADRYLHVSSQSAQGESAVVTEDPVWQPFSPYSTSKALGEQLLLDQADLRHLVVIFRALSVQGPHRGTTRRLVSLARSPMAVVSTDGPTPLTLIDNTAAAVVFAARYPGPVPSIVLAPDDGLSTAQALRLLGARKVRTVPRPIAKVGVGALKGLGRVDPRFTGIARRGELVMFGQSSKSDWFHGHGFTPVQGPEAWTALGDVVAAEKAPVAPPVADTAARTGSDGAAIVGPSTVPRRRQRRRGAATLRVVVLTTVHIRTDTRIFEKELPAIASIPGVTVTALVADGKGPEQRETYAVVDLGAPPAGRLGRFTVSAWQAFWYLLRHRPDIVHIHDPELLPVAFTLRLFGVRAIYDAHEDLPKDILDKYWIPGPLRRMIAAAVGVTEKLLSRPFAQVIAATPAIERNFGSHRTTCVQNFPKLSEFPALREIDPAAPRFDVCYLGAITRIRGLAEAVAAVGLFSPDVPGRLRLAGPITPEGFATELEGARRLGSGGLPAIPGPSRSGGVLRRSAGRTGDLPPHREPSRSTAEQALRVHGGRHPGHRVELPAVGRDHRRHRLWPFGRSAGPFRHRRGDPTAGGGSDGSPGHG